MLHFFNIFVLKYSNVLAARNNVVAAQNARCSGTHIDAEATDLEPPRYLKRRIPIMKRLRASSQIKTVVFIAQDVSIAGWICAFITSVIRMSIVI